jgi:hypothetical protein
MEGDEQLEQAGGGSQMNHNQEYQYGPLPTQNRRKEKINSILILAVGIFALLFSAGSFMVSINNPFADVLKQGAEQDKISALQQQAALLAQQTQDTDGDGLSDYDEINKYKTSPYLSDSDSDSIDDKSEILRGTDPNCPEGQQCFNTNPTPDENSLALAGSVDTIPTLTTDVQSAGIAITPAYIRDLMVQNGVDSTELKDVSDSDLMTEFAQFLQDNPDIATALSQQGVDVANFNPNTAVAATTDQTTDQTAGQTATLAQPNAAGVDLQSLNVTNVNDLKNLSGAQIRQLMVQAGASETLLSAVSDDDLKTMFIKQIDSKATK